MLAKAKNIIVKEEDRRFIGSVTTPTNERNIYLALVSAYMDGMATGAALVSNVPLVSENVKIPRETA